MWRNFYTEEIVEYVGKYDGGLTENCGLFVPPWGVWHDWSCVINKAQPIGCACEHPKQMYLHLRGLCPDSTIDQHYVPKNEDGNVQLIGKV